MLFPGGKVAVADEAPAWAAADVGVASLGKSSLLSKGSKEFSGTLTVVILFLCSGRRVNNASRIRNLAWSSDRLGKAIFLGT